MMMMMMEMMVVVHVCQGVVECERFLVEPQDAVVSRGQRHVLHCTVQDRIGEVQWLRDGFGLGPGDEFEGFPRYRIQRDDQRGTALLLKLETVTVFCFGELSLGLLQLLLLLLCPRP